MRLNWNNLGRGLEAIADARQRVDLAKAYGLTPQEQQAALATPEQLAGARAETQALQQQDIADFGLTQEEAQRYAPTMPQEGQRVGLSTYRVGDQTFQQAPTQSQLDTARMRAAADVYGRYGDTAKREELMRGLRAEERATAAETRAQQSHETQQQEAQYRLRELGRSEDATTRYNAFSEFAAKNPNMSTEELRNTARNQFGFTAEQELKYINTRLGLQEGETKEFSARVAKKLKGKSLTQLGELYNADSDFDDNTDLSIIPGKNGAVTLNFIDKKTGKTISSNSFGSEALAVEYLGKQATDPLNTGTWLLGVKAKEESINASRRQGVDKDAGAAIQQKIAAAEKALGRKLTENELQVALGLTTKPREDISPSAIATYAKDLVGKPTGKMQDGKPVRYTEETAYAAAEQIMKGGQTSSGLPAWGAAPAPTAAPAPVAPPQPSAAASGRKEGLAAVATDPRTRDEFQLAAKARAQGLFPVGRGNALFGDGELLFEDNTGRRVWASQVQ